MKPLSPSDPRTVGEFQLRALLGSGGMGRVYLAYSPGGRAVAVKVVRPELAGDPEFGRRFAREVDAAKSVSGMYTAPVVAAGLSDDPPWLATKFVPGPSLAELVEQHGPLPAPAVWRLAAGLTEALQAVHASGLVHRDLKPANVLLALDGPHVIDFGISRALDGASITQTGMVVGTPGYMAPEQAEGEISGPQSDVFSLGALLAYAATGKAPFGQGSAAAVLYRLVSADPDLSGVPGDLRDVIAGCMAKDPAERPAPGGLSGTIAKNGPGLSWSSSGSFWPSGIAGFIRASQQDMEQAEARAASGMGTGTAPGAGDGAGLGSAAAADAEFGAGAPPSGTLRVGGAAAREAVSTASPARDGKTRLAANASPPDSASLPGSASIPGNPSVPGSDSGASRAAVADAAVAAARARAAAASGPAGYSQPAPSFGPLPGYQAPGYGAPRYGATGYGTAGYGTPGGAAGNGATAGAPGNQVPPQQPRAGATPPPGPGGYSPRVPGYQPPPGPGVNAPYGPYGRSAPYRRRYVPSATGSPMVAASWLMRLGAALSILNVIVTLSSISQLKRSTWSWYPTMPARTVNEVTNGAVGAGVVGAAISVALWFWLAGAARRGRSWVRPVGTTLFGLYTLGVIGVIATPGIASAKGLSVAIWIVGLLAVITMWARRTTR